MNEEKDIFFRMLMKKMRVETPDEVRKGILSGDWVVAKPNLCWLDDGILCFTAVSDGTLGPDWTTRLEKKHPRVGNGAKTILNSPYFKPTQGVTYEAAILKHLPSKLSRTTENFRKHARSLRLLKPTVEVACLVSHLAIEGKIDLSSFTYVSVMHEPIKASDGKSYLLGVDCVGEGFCVSASSGEPEQEWLLKEGCLFLRSKVKIF